MDVKSALDVMYLATYNPVNYFEGRHLSRVVKVKKLFFDLLMSPTEIEILAEDIHTAQLQNEDDYARRITTRASFIYTLLSKLTKVFNTRWEAVLQARREAKKTRKIGSLTWNNIDEKWPKVLQYEESLRLVSMSAVFRNGT